jgi:hypothetical protein
MEVLHMAHVEEPFIPAPKEDSSSEAGQHRLQSLVSELLETNQELRFKVARLEQNLAEASAVYRLLAP